jgi:hypothetical protein
MDIGRAIARPSVRPPPAALLRPRAGRVIGTPASFSAELHRLPDTNAPTGTLAPRSTLYLGQASQAP